MALYEGAFYRRPLAGLPIRYGNQVVGVNKLKNMVNMVKTGEAETSRGCFRFTILIPQMGRAKRIWYLSPMRAAKVQASLRIRAVSPEPSLLAHTSSESRGTYRQKARSLVPMNGWACAVKICHDGMLENTNSLGAAQMTTRRKTYNPRRLN